MKNIQTATNNLNKAAGSTYTVMTRENGRLEYIKTGISSLKSANRTKDRLDNKYGGYKYFVQKEGNKS